MSIMQSLEREMSLVFPGGGGGGAMLPIMDYTGRFFPKRAPFAGWRYIKGWGFHLLNYRKGEGKLSFRYLQGISKYLKPRWTTSKCGAVLLLQVSKRGIIFFARYMKVTFAVKMVFEKVRLWNSGWRLSVYTFLKFPPSLVTFVY